MLIVISRMASTANRVAIVGGGPSGLAACKAALEEGLHPTLFEQSPGLGGLWRNDHYGKVWDNMRTNLSKYTCAFSDSPWPTHAPDFPGCHAVQEYLENYAKQHSLDQYVYSRSRVTAVEQMPDKSAWRVSWERNQTGKKEAFSEHFEFVVIASGIFSRPHMPQLPGMETFQGEALHAATYRSPVQFAKKNVLVVGAAFSGADIACDLAEHAAVTVSARRPIWYLPRYISGKPLDVAFYSRAREDINAKVANEDLVLKRHAFFATLAGELPDGIVAPNPSCGDLPFVTITDGFLNDVRNGRLTVLPHAVTGFTQTSVQFSNGAEKDFDAVIFATGYRLELPFLTGSSLETLEFDPNDFLQPVILHECVWRPELHNLAFVGMYRGPYFGTIELQARWACGVFSGRLESPSEVEVAAGLEKERQIRQTNPRPQFPHGDYVSMTDALAQRVKVFPEKILGSSMHALQKLLYEGPLLPFHYRLEGFYADENIVESTIEECSSRFLPELVNQSAEASKKKKKLGSDPEGIERSDWDQLDKDATQSGAWIVKKMLFDLYD